MWQVRWTNLYGVHVKFSQDLSYQQLLKYVNFSQSYSKNKKVDVLGHGVVLKQIDNENSILRMLR